MAASTSDVHYTSDGVHRQIDVIKLREEDMCRHIRAMQTQLQELATTFVDIGAADKVPTCRDMFKDLLVMHNDVNVHTQALDSVKRSYKAGAKPTKFGNLLEQTTRELMASHQFDPEANDSLKDFDKETGTASTTQQEDEDDDVVDLDRGNALLNDKCPLTMKSVFALEEAVADSKGFIYEKAAILHVIKEARKAGHAACNCPVAGTQHTVAEKDLKPATKLERIKRQRKLNPEGPSKQPQRETQTVYDADDM